MAHTGSAAAKSAVALQYPENADAPLIACKEKGELAEKMLQIARENNIPVIQDQLLENVLSAAEIGQCIPEEAWQTVAEIFAFIQETESKNGYIK